MRLEQRPPFSDSFCRVQRIDKRAKMPTKAHYNDAAWDFYCIADDTFVPNPPDNGEIKYLLPYQRHLFRTGIKLLLPQGPFYIANIPHHFQMLLWDRSSLSSKKGVHRLAGVVDNGYTGEIRVCLHNTSRQTVGIECGEKIIQGVITLVPSINMIEVEELAETNRGEKGFGSSD